MVGGFTIDGRAMSLSTEGERDAPVAESSAVLEKATRAIASQYECAGLVEPGLLAVPGPAGETLARVVVTRDHRVRRPQDLLCPDELVQFQSAELALVIVQLIGGGKALVIKHGV
ncbi:MAG: hypothetical protein RBS17_11315 [Coriobacteriia bacterium]|nr:hypothetical protein [Coriobacteriia bacterium]